MVKDLDVRHRPLKIGDTIFLWHQDRRLLAAVLMDRVIPFVEALLNQVYPNNKNSV